MSPNVAASIKARLLNEANRRREPFEPFLVRFVCERFLHRLGASELRDRCTLKGAGLLTLWLQDPYRATRDVDLLVSGMSDEATVRASMETICRVPCPEDGLDFDLESVSVLPIRDEQKYAGQRAVLRVFLGKARVRLQVDFGFGDALSVPPEGHLLPRANLGRLGLHEPRERWTLRRGCVQSPMSCRVDRGPRITQNVGMSVERADKSGHRALTADPAERLRAGRLGAFFRPSQVAEAGITREQLRALVRRGTVEHVGRGLYRMADAEPTEHYSLAMACARVPNSIVCLLSALRVHGIGTQAPAEVWLAIPHKARRPRLPGQRLRIVRFSGPAWTFGVRATTFEGVPARITTPARTVVDCFRYRYKVGIDVAMEALRDAVRSRITTVDQISRASEMCRIHKVMAPYLEALSS